MHSGETYHLLNEPGSLEAVLERLAGSAVLGVDTESSNYFTYSPFLCLIQISVFQESNPNPDINYLVDPLKLKREEVYSLNDVFKDRNVVKIFHSAEDDIRLLKKDFDFDICNVFDTHLASRYLGRLDLLSLQKLVKAFFNEDLDKKWQKADWRIRPLKDEQLRYAMYDTVFLNAIRLKQVDMFKERQAAFTYEAKHSHLAEFNDHCLSLEHTGYQAREHGSDDWMKLSRKLKTPPPERMLLRLLYNTRIQTAVRKNIAAFRVVPDSILKDLAQLLRGIHSESGYLGLLENRLANCPDFAEDMRGQWPQVEEAIKDNWHEYEYVDHDRLTPSENKQLKNIQLTKTKLGEARDLEPTLIFPKKSATAFLKRIIANPETEFSVEELCDVLSWSQLKFELYGEEIRQLEQKLRQKYRQKKND